MAESFFDRVHKQDTHTPDVLACLANLSNDEVFTPPEIVNQMLDMLPQELFKSSETTFLDPACKTGVFLREIAKRLLDNQVPLYQEKMQLINEKKSLNIPLTVEDEIIIERLQKTIDHIFHKQLYGIAITELTSLLSRRSLYCSKYPNGEYSISHFDDAEGNIRYRRMKHTWGKDKKCVFCGTSQDGELGEDARGNFLETHAYEFIHTVKPEEILNMKFDVIISNPPYQLNDGGGTGSSAMPIYQYFIEQAEKLNPRYITMITPSRWFAGGKGLDSFREHMLESNHISTIVDFPNSADCFPGVIIAGGVNYFLWQKDYNGKCKVINRKNNDIESSSIRSLNEYPVFVRDNVAIKIINKIKSKTTTFMDEIVYSRNCFDLESKETGHSNKKEDDYTLYSLNGKSYISKTAVSDREKIVSKYKVMMTKAMSGGNKPSSDGRYLVISNTMRVLRPMEVCTETYLCMGNFDNEVEATNLSNYLKTKFFRFLLLQALSSINISKDKFMFVPVIDFKKSVTDEELFNMFDLEIEEISYIENLIRSYDLFGGEE